MQKTLTVNGRRFTAKQIVNLPCVECQGGDYKTILGGEYFFWNYRQVQDEFFAPVCSKENADGIALMRDCEYRYTIWLSL